MSFPQYPSDNANSSDAPSPSERNGRDSGARTSGRANAETHNSQSSDIDPLNSTVPETGKRYRQARRSAIKVYAVLIAIGLSLGGITLFGVAKLMQKFGLTEVPARTETEQVN